jgi:Rrf2 family protein
MNLTLSRRGDYAVRAAIFLAMAWDEGGGYRKIREVAEVMDLPLGYAPQVLGILAEAGIAEAKAGRQGGYRLARSPARISLLEIVEAAEGYLASERCPLRGGPCHWDDVCALHPTLTGATEAIRATLSHTALSEVAAVDRELRSGMPVEAAPLGHRDVSRARSDLGPVPRNAR